jgi:transposase
VSTTPFLLHVPPSKRRLNIGRESLRRWGLRPRSPQRTPRGLQNEQSRIRELESENRELREANEILKKASIFFTREPDPRRRKKPDSSGNCVPMVTGSSRPARSCVSRACRLPRRLTGPGNPKYALPGLSLTPASDLARYRERRQNAVTNVSVHRWRTLPPGGTC